GAAQLRLLGSRSLRRPGPVGSRVRRRKTAMEYGAICGLDTQARPRPRPNGRERIALAERTDGRSGLPGAPNLRGAVLTRARSGARGALDQCRLGRGGRGPPAAPFPGRLAATRRACRRLDARSKSL